MGKKKLPTVNIRMCSTDVSVLHQSEHSVVLSSKESTLFHPLWPVTLHHSKMNTESLFIVCSWVLPFAPLSFPLRVSWLTLVWHAILTKQIDPESNLSTLVINEIVVFSPPLLAVLWLGLWSSCALISSSGSDIHVKSLRRAGQVHWFVKLFISSYQYWNLFRCHICSSHLHFSTSTSVDPLLCTLSLSTSPSLLLSLSFPLSHSSISQSLSYCTFTFSFISLSFSLPLSVDLSPSSSPPPLQWSCFSLCCESLHVVLMMPTSVLQWCS